MGDSVRAAPLRDLLDGVIRGKEIASQFFQSLAGSVDDVQLRRCFRRLAQEEWDHRKILLKHRRELFGRIEALRDARAAGHSPVFAAFARKPIIGTTDDLRLALRVAIRTEQEAHRFFFEASRTFDDRAVKVFLRILAEEGLAQVDHLREALLLVDAVGTLRRRRRAVAAAVGN
ncbi:MAG TPA: ferritin family protein [Planctomycetota bacterium]|nr:ferritin family protein [Planctomycetota bacterium]